MPRAFAHNDYAQPRPLWDALAHGFTGIEVDVFLDGGELLVGHGRRDLVPGRTIESLYLDPLATLVERTGQVYGDRSLLLLVDVKGNADDAVATYAALHERLAAHPQLFTQYRPAGALTGPVDVVVSGHTDLPLMEAQVLRFATADARVDHLDETVSPVVKMVSAKWGRHFSWLGEDTMDAEERESLHRWVERIHDARCQARFWGTTPATWRELLAAGVDWIVADELADLRQVLLSAGGNSPATPSG